MSNTFNQQNTGNNNQNNQGVNIEAGDVRNEAPDGDGKPEPTVENFLKVLEAPKALPDEVIEDVVPQLNRFAMLPEAEQRGVMHTDQWKTILEKIQPHAGTIGKSMAVFGAAALKSFASTNPICAGVLAVCETFQSES